MANIKNTRKKKIVWFIVTIIILLCISGIVAGALFVFVFNTKSKSAGDVKPKISNTINHQQLIQTKITNFINKNNWFTNKTVRNNPQYDATIKSDNPAQWNSHFKNVWSEQIRVNDAKTYFLNLQNVTIDNLNNIIDNPDLWSANQLYFQNKIVPYIPNIGASKQLINNVLVTFIKKNRWFNTKPNDTGALPPQISIGTVPNNNKTNDGVQWNVGKNGDSSYWSIRILSGAGSTWTTFTTLNLGNFQTKDQLNTLIQNPALWGNNKNKPAEDLFFIENLTADDVKNAVNNYLNDVNTKSGGFHVSYTNENPNTYTLEFDKIENNTSDFYSDTVDIKGGVKDGDDTTVKIQITGKSSYALEESTKSQIGNANYLEGSALTEKIISDTVKSYLHGKVFHCINDVDHYKIDFDVDIKDKSNNNDFTEVIIGIKISNDKDSNIIKKNITIKGITTTLLTTSTENQVNSLGYEEGNPVNLSPKQIATYITNYLNQIKSWLYDDKDKYHLHIRSFLPVLGVPGHWWIRIVATKATDTSVTDTSVTDTSVKDNSFIILLKTTILIKSEDVIALIRAAGYTPFK